MDELAYIYGCSKCKKSFRAVMEVPHGLRLCIECGYKYLEDVEINGHMKHWNPMDKELLELIWSGVDEE